MVRNLQSVGLYIFQLEQSRSKISKSHNFKVKNNSLYVPTGAINRQPYTSKTDETKVSPTHNAPFNCKSATLSFPIPCCPIPLLVNECPKPDESFRKNIIKCINETK